MSSVDSVELHMSEKINNLEELGFNPRFDAKVKELALVDFSPARVIEENKGSYKVKNTEGEFLAKITGKRMFEATGREDFPAVGDWVMVGAVDKDQMVIEEILPRQSIIKRRFGDKNKFGGKKDVQIIATNIDVTLVVESVDRDYNLNRFERYFAILEEGGVRGAIVLNKIDLLSEDEKRSRLSELRERFPSVDIIMTSTKEEDGLRELTDYIEEGKTYCFLGSSGVGKSSLINKLLGGAVIATGDVGLASQRGKHTTTRRQMYFLVSGGIVIDNPGIREVGGVDLEEGLDSLYEEITELGQNCKYTNCTHSHEPGCAVMEALKANKIDADKYANYISLKKEAEFYQMSAGEKRQKGKSFGKFISQAKKELKDAGYESFQ